MNNYRKILIWENKKRLNKVIEFRQLLLDYFDNIRNEWMASQPIEQETAKQSRTKINKILDEVHEIIFFADVNPKVTHIPPPAIGGHVQDIDLVYNVFNFHSYNIPPTLLYDYVDRTIGIYEKNKHYALMRTINPFFYLNRSFVWLAKCPFAGIGYVGFNQTKAESSIFGRLIKVFIYFSSWLAALISALEGLNILEPIKNFLIRLSGY